MRGRQPTRRIADAPATADAYPPKLAATSRRQRAGGGRAAVEGPASIQTFLRLARQVARMRFSRTRTPATRSVDIPGSALSRRAVNAQM